MDLDLKWRRRNLNVEADKLTNENFDGFLPENRVDASGVARNFLCLNTLAGVWKFVPEEEKKGVAPARGHREKKRKINPLREREPW